LNIKYESEEGVAMRNNLYIVLSFFLIILVAAFGINHSTGAIINQLVVQIPCLLALLIAPYLLGVATYSGEGEKFTFGKYLWLFCMLMLICVGISTMLQIVSVWLMV